MRKVYLWLSGIFIIVGLIICFENIMIPANGLMIGFHSMVGSVFFPLTIVMTIGFISGLFAGLALVAKKHNPEDEEDDLDL